MPIRVESPYVPLDMERNPFPSLHGKKAEYLTRLIKEAGAVPRNALHRLILLRHGQYMFLAFDSENDLPVALATCIIMETGAMSYGVITDLVVLPEYRKNGLAHSLVHSIIARMSSSSVLAASDNKELALLRVAIGSEVISCQKIFEDCDFKLVHGNGENLYEYRLQNSAD